MKRLLFILGVFFYTCSTILSAEQVSDILIIGKDTFYLNSFPFDYIRLKHKIKEPPFDDDILHTGCWRGYIATWQVIDETLILKEVKNIDSAGTRLNIIEYFERNGYIPKTINGFVIADVYSDSLKSYDFHRYNYAHRVNDFFLSSGYSEENDKKVELVFENGRLIENNIIPIEAYKIGDILSLYMYYFQNWIFWGDPKKVRVQGTIRDNNGKKVRLEILSFGTDKERIKRKIQKEIKDLDKFWVNPRYCKIEK